MPARYLTPVTVPSAKSSVRLNSSNDGATISPGCYLLDSSAGPFAVLLDYVAGAVCELRDIGGAQANNISAGTQLDIFNLGDGLQTGPLVVDTPQVAAEIVADPDTARLFHVYFHSGIAAPAIPPEQLVATLPFTM